MVCDRCIVAVNDAFKSAGFDVVDVVLGKVNYQQSDTQNDKELVLSLEKMGFELVERPHEKLAEQVKALLIDLVNSLPKLKEVPNLSKYLTDRIPYTYPTISRRFSAVESRSIEQVYLNTKIEKVKELLSYQEKTLTEISWELKYSSVQHLSNQFHKITGITVSDYIQKEHQDRTKLDELY